MKRAKSSAAPLTIEARVFAEIVAELTPERCAELRAVGIDPGRYAFEAVLHRLADGYRDHAEAQQRRARARRTTDRQQAAILAIAAATGQQRKRLAAELAEQTGGYTDSVLRKARRLAAKVRAGL